MEIGVALVSLDSIAIAASFLDIMRVKVDHSAHRPHLQFLGQNEEKRCGLYAGFYGNSVQTKQKFFGPQLNQLIQILVMEYMIV